jgi:hypothetical protein
MKCYQCVVQSSEEWPDGIPQDKLNDAVFIINGHSVCGILDHIDAVCAEPGSSGVTIARETPLDPERRERLKVSGRPLLHSFRPVEGHPDDDECTYRADGTDDTYCGEPRHRHLL